MRRLYTRIYLHMLLVLIAATLAIGGISAVGMRGEYRRGLVQRLTTLAADIVGERFDDPMARTAVIEKMARALDVELTVRATDGELLVATGAPMPELSPDEAARVLAGECVLVHVRQWTAATAVRRPGSSQVVAFLQAALPHGHMPGPPLVATALYVAVVLIIIGVAALPLAHRVSTPVERLTEAMRRFGSGELDYRIRTPGLHAAIAAKLDELGRLELAWNRMADRLEELVVSHRDLLANVSHELRSPLARLRLMLELLPASPERDARVADIERELSDLDRLVEAVLTVARLEAASIPVAHTPFEARALLETLRERATDLPALAAQPLSVRADPGLTACGDEALLRRALWNLIDNATKYGAAPIELFAQAEEGGVCFGVSDAGPGIPATERGRVLEPFVRGSNVAGPSTDRGFGLGLTLASRIAKAHGGSLSIEDAGTPGKGCRVIVHLPQHDHVSP